MSQVEMFTGRRWAPEEAAREVGKLLLRLVEEDAAAGGNLREFVVRDSGCARCQSGPHLGLILEDIDCLCLDESRVPAGYDEQFRAECAADEEFSRLLAAGRIEMRWEDGRPVSYTVLPPKAIETTGEVQS